MFSVIKRLPERESHMLEERGGRQLHQGPEHQAAGPDGAEVPTAQGSQRGFDFRPHTSSLTHALIFSFPSDPAPEAEEATSQP